MEMLLKNGLFLMIAIAACNSRDAANRDARINDTDVVTSSQKVFNPTHDTSDSSDENLGNGKVQNTPSVSVNRDEHAMTMEIATTPDNAIGISNRMAAMFYQQIARRHKGNFAFSPVGIAFVLTALNEGANGETRREISRVLRTGKSTSDSASFARWQRELNAKNNARFTLSSAGGIWLQKGNPFESGFLKLARQRLGMSIAMVDFVNAPTLAADRINQWVAGQTRNLISEIVSPDAFSETDTTEMLLVSALYLKAMWQNPFEEYNTKEKSFRLVDGKRAKVPMMHHEKGDFTCGRIGDFLLLEMPYRQSTVTMTVLLPDSPKQIFSLGHRFNAKQFFKWQKTLRSREALVRIPKFKFATKASLETALQELGIEQAFNPKQASFLNISTSDKIYLSDLLQQTVVDVDEYGTEAASVTVARARSSSMTRGPRPKPFVFNANRPFIFVIADKRKKSILFVGRVLNPNQI